MRAILTVLCLFCGSPDDVAAESLGSPQEAKVETFRALLSELASSGTVSDAKTPTDLPEGLMQAIEDWTRD